ncbi:Uncharacterised protein [Vibrio cholerae]|nr:Uncharacterised protein [Vibrio cholerae]
MSSCASRTTACKRVDSVIRPLKKAQATNLLKYSLCSRYG